MITAIFTTSVSPHKFLSSPEPIGITVSPTNIPQCYYAISVRTYRHKGLFSEGLSMECLLKRCIGDIILALHYILFKYKCGCDCYRVTSGILKLAWTSSETTLKGFV